MTNGRGVFIAVLGLAVVGALAAILVPGAAGPLGIALLVYVAASLGLVVHESGHFVAGWLLGYRVTDVELGSGPTITRFPLKGCRIAVRVLPFRGLTGAAPPTSPHKIVRLVAAVVFALGGVIANGLIVVGALLVGGPPMLTAVLVAGNALGVLDLVPTRSRDRAGRSALSDGALVILAFETAFDEAGT